MQKVETAGDCYIVACGLLADDGEGFFRIQVGVEVWRCEGKATLPFCTFQDVPFHPFSPTHPGGMAERRCSPPHTFRPLSSRPDQ